MGSVLEASKKPLIVSPQSMMHKIGPTTNKIEAIYYKSQTF